MCESVPVSPCPGKCLAVASIPCSCSPRISADTNIATASGFSPNERVLMIGLAALLLTSATGAKSRWMPTARPSIAVIRPISYASNSRPVAATPILVGKAVPPLNRMAVPPSRSDATSSGIRDDCCSTLSLAAMSSGEPMEAMMPPTSSESTQARAFMKPGSSAAAYVPGIHGITSWATLARSGRLSSSRSIRSVVVRPSTGSEPGNPEIGPGVGAGGVDAAQASRTTVNVARRT